MSDQTTGIFDMTVPTTMVWPALLEAKPYMEAGKQKGEPKFGATFLFTPEHVDLKAAKALAVGVARGKWPGISLKEVGWPVSSGDEYAAKRDAGGKDGALCKGKALLKARSKYEPMLSWVEGGKIKEIPSTTAGSVAQAKFFSGASVLATFNFVAVEVSGKKYVTAYLNKVFSTGKGERVGGGRSAAEAFKGYIGHATAEDPTAGSLDDEIPF
jgi:hypothetical protein